MGARNSSRIIACIMLIISAILLWYSLHVGVLIGADWFGKDATFQWHMNNYMVMDAKYAYSIFGLATMVIGGLATGLTMPAFFTITRTPKHVICLVAAFFVAIIMTGLGFNTLDFMLGSFYWTNMQYPPPIQIPFFGSVDVWNFYFYFFVIPLWASGFIMGLAGSTLKFTYLPQHAMKMFLRKNLSPLSKQSADEKAYIVELTAFPRSRKHSKLNFHN